MFVDVSCCACAGLFVRTWLGVCVDEAYSSRMLIKRAIVLGFVGLGAAAAMVAFGSVTLAAGIHAAESERQEIT